jgi:hypothetical protein
MGHGALLGGGLGAAFGLGGSLTVSAARRSFMSRLAGGAESAVAEAPSGLPLPSVDADAGLREAATHGEDVFAIGAERKPVFLHPGGRSVAEGGPLESDGFTFTKHPNARRSETTVMVDTGALDRAWQKDHLYIAPGEEGIEGRRSAFGNFLRDRPTEPIQAPRINIADDGRVIFTDGRHRFASLRDMGVNQVAVTLPKREIGRLPSPKSVRFAGNLLRTDENIRAIETKSPIVLPSPQRSAVLAKTGGLEGIFSNPVNAALSEANNQAWSAVGRGFGWQTSRYAKEAQRYFDNGTSDLGATMRKYGLIDAGPATLSPDAAAWRAAKSGTPAEILPRAQIALETVGKQIGDLTASSGATIGTAEIRAAFREARAPFSRIAGRESEVAALNAYEDSLLGKLGGTAALEGGNVPVRIQDVLEQRKGLDQIIYGETKTLDPRGRVQILRDARSELESLITKKLDEASGLVPGDMKASYQALKKDYHGLRIITDAAEDSAARAAKGGTFSLTSKIVGAAAHGTGAVIGGMIAGPLGAAAGGLAGGAVGTYATKFLQERGNAAAAAYLSRYAEQAALRAQMQRVNATVAKSAASVLREPAPSAARSAMQEKLSPKAQAASREQARAQVEATQKQATGIVKWIGDFNANPARFSQQMEEAATLVGRVAGPQGAEGYTAATMRAIRFIAAHIPAKERRDPLDPRSIPPLTQDEAERLVRATRYALKPDTILDDFGRGIITPEGLRGAKVLLPQEGSGSFADFQAQLLDHVTDHMLRNRQLTWTQRLNLDKLGIESLRPDRIARLQADMMSAPPEPPPAGQQGPGPLDMKIQHSGFDSVEARLAG